MSSGSSSPTLLVHLSPQMILEIYCITALVGRVTAGFGVTTILNRPWGDFLPACAAKIYRPASPISTLLRIIKTGLHLPVEQGEVGFFLMTFILRFSDATILADLNLGVYPQSFGPELTST